MLNMAKENGEAQRVKCKAAIATMVNIEMIARMDLVCINGPVEMSTKVNMSMMREVGKER